MDCERFFSHFLNTWAPKNDTFANHTHAKETTKQKEKHQRQTIERKTETAQYSVKNKTALKIVVQASFYCCTAGLCRGVNDCVRKYCNTCMVKLTKNIHLQVWVFFLRILWIIVLIFVTDSGTCEGHAPQPDEQTQPTRHAKQTKVFGQRHTVEDRTRRLFLSRKRALNNGPFETEYGKILLVK